MISRRERTEQERLDDEQVVRQYCGDAAFEYDDSGGTSRVYVVDSGATVVKFGRDRAARDECNKEIEALRICGAIHSSVRTPRVVSTGPAHRYVVFDGVIGQTLDHHLDDLSDNALTTIGANLGAFLTELHHCEMEIADEIDVADEIVAFHEKFEIASSTLESHFNDHEMRRIRAFRFEEFPTTMRLLGGESSLCHGDLGPWNMVLSPDEALGIIDFGDVAYRDPSIDFAGLRNATLTSAALESYGADTHFRAKVDIRSRAFHIADLPFYVGLHNAQGLNTCLESVRNCIVK